MFEVASVLGLAKRFGHNYTVPLWDKSKYFDHDFKQGDVPFFDRTIKEDGFAYNEEFWAQNLSNPNETVNITGYLQSPKYWGEDHTFVKNLFRFKKSFTEPLDKLFKRFDDENTVAVHIRRGDYSGNPNYFNLDVRYYLNALDKIPYSRIIVFTDDYGYCKETLPLEEISFAFEGLSDMEHLYLMTKCDHFVLSNSTFSWWGAYLGEKKHSVVVRPDVYFTGKLKDLDIKDFWPTNWLKETSIQDKNDLSDVTFVIPLSYDCKDRKNNIQVLIRNLVKNFRAKIILGEQGSYYRFRYLEKFVTKYLYFENMQDFHRTKMINDMVRMADTKIVVVCDSDVLIPRSQYIKAADKIRHGNADIVYPYDGRFVRCSRMPWTDIFNKDPYKVNSMDGVYDGMMLHEKESFGGVFVVNKGSYIKAGMENENFVSFGREDVERNDRFKKLGLIVKREKGCLYHLQHKKGINSTMRHPHAEQNRLEARKVIDMDAASLKQYVATWGWLKT